MKYKRLAAEAAVYGIVSAVYASMFFGALYPKYGLPAQSVVTAEKSDEADQQVDDMEATATNKEKVAYKSLIFERIKEWF